MIVLVEHDRKPVRVEDHTELDKALIEIVAKHNLRFATVKAMDDVHVMVLSNVAFPLREEAGFTLIVGE
jgi:hypothetical protein